MSWDHMLATAFFMVCVWSQANSDCVYDTRGLCMSECPPGTVSYGSPCDFDAVAYSQRTCRQPKPRSLGSVCDLSRCDCPEPRVWDEAARKCVAVNECSDQTNAKGINDIFD